MFQNIYLLVANEQLVKCFYADIKLQCIIYLQKAHHDKILTCDLDCALHFLAQKEFDNLTDMLIPFLANG